MAAAPIRGLRNLRVIFGCLAVLIVIGTIGFHVIEGWSWFDSFYEVLITVTTIGSSHGPPLTEMGRSFSVFVIIVGVGLVFLAIGALASALLEFELRKFFGRRRMERDINRLNNHVIICGAGRVGRSVARELVSKPAPFVVVDNNPDKMQKLDERWLALNGDATQETTLRDARIDHQRSLTVHNEFPNKLNRLWMSADTRTKSDHIFSVNDLSQSPKRRCRNSAVVCFR